MAVVVYSISALRKKPGIGRCYTGSNSELVGRHGFEQLNVRLVIFREDGSRRDFPLEAGATTIGRMKGCAIRIPLAVVSRRHAEVVLGDGGAVLKDLGAANGTFLNNRRIMTEETLEAGDQFMVGPVVFTVQIDGEPPDDEIVKIRTKTPEAQAGGSSASRVGTSKHVYMSDEEVDPIAALEALASSADQTAIEPDEFEK